MASTAETKKPRVRKTTPRARSKKSPAEAKKATTPRRRASPRNLRKAQEIEAETKKEKEEVEKKEEVKVKQVEEAAAPPAAVKEEEKTQETEASKQELAPAQDTQLRRTYLQRMYRQLQSTHPNQDDTMIRQFATNVEMEACQKSATRSQYIATMDQEIHKLMQFEMEQANATMYTDDAPSFDNVNANTQAQPVVSSDIQGGGYSQNQISQSRSYEYAQALAKAQSHEQVSNGGGSSAFSTPRQSMGGDNSFQSPMGSQTQGYGRNVMQQMQQQSTPNRAMSMQNLQQMGNQYYPTSSATPPTSQSFSIQSNIGEMSGQGMPRSMIGSQQQVGHFPMQQQQRAGPVRSQPRAATLQEFSAQIQHLEKPVLIELLWSQRNALAYWQQRTNQLDLQLSALQNAASNMRSPSFHSPYNSPMVGGASFVSPSVSAEAEMQRARERNNTRNMQQQQMPPYAYVQPSNENRAVPFQSGGNQASWGENAQLYWEKIRVMKNAFAEQLRIAKRALARHTAPPNSIYSAKAQSVMDNIGLVIDILDEQPTNVQPRKFEVLTSMERFIQITVVPIVRKVQSSFIPAESQTTVISGPTQGVATSVSTYAPGAPPARDGDMGGMTVPGGDNQYGGPRWDSSSSSFSRVDNSRQSSRGVFMNPSSGGEDTVSRMDNPTRMMDGLTLPVENNPPNGPEMGYASSQYAAVRPENAGVEAVETDASAGQTLLFEASTTIPKESSSTAVSTSEFHPLTVTEMCPSSGAGSSPSENAKDSNSNKMVRSASVEDLNDFTDFPELDFETMPENSNFVKENNPSNTSRKQGIEDV